MKIAIVQDELVRRGGAEQVVLSLHKAFPEAPIYTLAYNAISTYPEFKRAYIKQTWFGKFFNSDKNLKRFFFPLGVIAMRNLHLKGYDVVLQSTTHCSKYIRTDPSTLIITYCHTPFRLVFRPDSYEGIANSKLLKRKAYDLIIKILKNIDVKSANKTEWFLTNSKDVVPRIVKAYVPKNPVTVINPPVKIRNFYVSNTVEDYYLVVSRLEPYKKVDIVIEAINRLPEKRLIIIGAGSLETELKDKAGKNITFLKSIDRDSLSKYYSNCRALIFPQLEDYGITPLEAIASGRPVIAYGKGGVTDTMIPYTELTGNKATALFFKEQSVECVIAAVEKFETLSFDPIFLRTHAASFDEKMFVNRIKAFIKEKYILHEQPKIQIW
jgi:glycosyltransferase involved in cell wall biosynthesis